MSFIEKASKALGCDRRKDGRPCTRVTKVLLCNRGITRTQTGFCGRGKDDRHMIES